MKKILVLGSSNMDFVIRVAEMPQIGETLLCKDFAQIPGGKGANQAYACGRLGGNVIFLSAVGQDGMGQAAIQNLLDAGVDCSNVQFCSGTNTGMAMICVNNDGNNSIVVIPGANSACTADYILQRMDLLKQVDIVLAQLEIPCEGVYEMLKAAHGMGKLTILNPAPAPEAIPEEVYPCLDYITPNETELHRLTLCGMDTQKQICAGAAQLLEKGAKNVIVTLGHRGALLMNAGTKAVFAPPSVKAVDTTAAGDTFNGAIAVKLAEGAAITEAIPFANAASALAVSRKGAQTSVPSREEVDGFIQKGEII